MKNVIGCLAGWFLVLHGRGDYPSVVIPEKYDNVTLCQQAGPHWANKWWRCVPDNETIKEMGANPL